MRHQYQFDNDDDRQRRIDRESRKAITVMLCFLIAIPIILLIMGYIVMCGQQSNW